VPPRNTVRVASIEVAGVLRHPAVVSFVVVSLLHSLRLTVRSRASLHLEIIALRHQLAVVNRSRRPRLRLTSVDRMLGAWLAHAWCGWRSAVDIVKPETVVAWHRRGFRLFWTWRSRRRTGRPAMPHDVRALIREMSTANPLWGFGTSFRRTRRRGISSRIAIRSLQTWHHHRRHDHPDGSNRAASTVAERLRGTRHRLHPTRVPRSRDRDERNRATSSARGVRRALPTRARISRSARTRRSQGRSGRRQPDA